MTQKTARTGNYRALSATCTHLGCIVQYRSDLQEIWCACHNGLYDLNGRNISGPPPRPLAATKSTCAATTWWFHGSGRHNLACRPAPTRSTNDSTRPPSPLPCERTTVAAHHLSHRAFPGGIPSSLCHPAVCTGILLLLYYRPSANEAFESVQYIMTRVQFGWLVRSIHSWAANLLIFTAFCHMFSVLFLEPTAMPWQDARWMSGSVVALRVMALVLRTDPSPVEYAAFFATKARNGHHRTGTPHRAFSRVSLDAEVKYVPPAPRRLAASTATLHFCLASLRPAAHAPRAWSTLRDERPPR